MKRLITLLLAMMMIAATAIPATAAEYNFSSGDTPGAFGGATSYDEPVAPNPETINERRNKDA
ncbi:MAG: hypothetical protein LBT12_07940, partial [Oscillospiraceae bacterium]|nr:hypothetical protein [Oscillospiraceae bacterium]